MDGNLLVHSDYLSGCEDPCHLDQSKHPVLVTANVPTGNHTFAIKVTDAAGDGNGVLIKAYLADSPTDKRALLDTTWKCWFAEQAGWKTAGFDDANWINPGVIDAADRTASQVPFIYPNTFWYRKTFTSKEATRVIANIRQGRVLLDGAIKAHEYYTLRGRKVIRSDLAHRTGAGVIVERQLLKDGRTRIRQTTDLR
jgi:hypothetical protein